MHSLHAREPTPAKESATALDHRKGVRYADLFQGRAACLERYHHRPAWIHDEPEALMQGPAFGLDSFADHGTTSCALLNAPCRPCRGAPPDAAASSSLIPQTYRYSRELLLKVRSR